MSISKVAIVGRPNVGKSSIFNWLAGRRLAIVDGVAGVTRDRMTFMMFEENRYFEIIDTGGIGINDVDQLTHEIEDQISVAIDTADVIVFVVDAQTGITSLDQHVAERLRVTQKPILLIVNKADHKKLDDASSEFFSLGYGDFITTSTTQNRNKWDVIESIVKRLPAPSEIQEVNTATPEMKIAIVGRRNVGKSTFINTLTDSERMIVSEVAGTTRDSVDVRFEMDGKAFVAIDTPGLRKGKAVRTDVEFYSTHRAQRTIRYADVTLMFFDCKSRISKVDRKLCSYIADQNKPCIFVVNKWDLLVDDLPTERWSDYLRDHFRTLAYCPIAFITGQSGRNVKKLLNHAQMLHKQSHSRVSTGFLNRLTTKALRHHPPPLLRKRRPKIFYATQVGTAPPTIVIICNDPDSFDNTYRRYLLSVFRDELPFGEVPIRLFFRKREQTDRRDDVNMDSGDNQFVDSSDNQFVDSGDSQFVDSGKVVEKPLDINWDSYTNPPPASGNDLAGE
ncbi:MAG: ribosome biogenesis GTPase Der [Pirellulaceae bacterium]|nr:ribosome biogenesis GTPase Der [Pirellulaceae bacterium]